MFSDWFYFFNVDYLQKYVQKKKKKLDIKMEVTCMVKHEILLELLCFQIITCVSD